VGVYVYVYVCVCVCCKCLLWSFLFSFASPFNYSIYMLSVDELLMTCMYDECKWRGVINSTLKYL